MIFRLRDFIFYPVAIKQFHGMLAASQYWNHEKRRGWIQEHLERTLRHAVKNVPYYRRTLEPYASHFTDMIDRLDLSALPFITKETVRNYYQELHADDCQQYRPTPTHTSGSTGTPTKFLLDSQSNISHFASIWRVLNWAGYRFGDRFADLTGHVFKNDNLYERDMRLKCLRLSSFNFKKENVPLYVEKLKKFKPVLIKAYPSALDLFCRWLQETGIRDYHPASVLTCAESLLDHQKIMIEETLRCPVFDFYNQNERAGLISTCEKAVYHIHEEYSYIEIVNKSNDSESLRQMGEIVTTSLHNFAMPLIRYRTDDLASHNDDNACECGRTYKRIKQIVGRVEDVVVTPDGRHVGRLDAAFKFSPGIRMSQIVQNTTEEIDVNLVKTESFNLDDLNTVERELHARLGKEVGINFRFVDSIPPGENGKVKFVISKPGKELFHQHY
jgi:phenylacetate-CoA ligase